MPIPVMSPALPPARARVGQMIRRLHGFGPRCTRRSAALPLLAALLLLCCSASAPADEPVWVGLPSGLDLRVLPFPSGGEQLLIWLPSKYGIRPGNEAFAETVRGQGIDYWLVDLHESYLAPTGRDGYAEFEPQHVKELIDHAVAQGWRNIVIGGESRGAALAMQAARLWQLDHPGNSALKGLLLFHPYLIEGRTPIGEQARLLPIVHTTNLPVYIFQPELNTKFLYSRQLLAQLQSGGAAVYFHLLRDVRGGYHTRDADRLRPREVEDRALLGQRVRQALDLLADSPLPQRAAPSTRADPLDGGVDAPVDTVLDVIRGVATPALRLTDTAGQTVGLDSHRGEVVLVNFWATWCGPCVREIASLIRLVAHFDGRPFRVLAVNVGESSGHVAEFFATRGIEPNFEVLFDEHSEAAQAWRVYAVPSTYLLDRQQRIRYGYRGALRWDDDDVIGIVESLLATAKDGALQR